MPPRQNRIEISEEADEFGKFVLVNVSQEIPGWVVYSDEEHKPSPLMLYSDEAYVISYKKNLQRDVHYFLTPCPPDALTYGRQVVSTEAIEEAYEIDRAYRRDQRSLPFLLSIPIELLVGSFPHRWVEHVAKFIPIDAERAALITAYPLLIIAVFCVIGLFVGGGVSLLLLGFYCLIEFGIRVGSIYVGERTLGFLPLEVMDSLIVSYLLPGEELREAEKKHARFDDTINDESMTELAQKDLNELRRKIDESRRRRRWKKSDNDLRVEEVPNGNRWLLRVTVPRTVPTWKIYTGKLGDQAPTLLYRETAFVVVSQEEQNEGVIYEMEQVFEDVYTSGTVELSLEKVREAWEDEDIIKSNEFWFNDAVSIPFELLISQLPSRWQMAITLRYPIDIRRGNFLTVIPIAAMSVVFIYAAFISQGLGDSDTAIRSLYFGLYFLLEGGARLLLLMSGSEAVGWLPLELAERFFRLFFSIGQKSKPTV